MSDHTADLLALQHWRARAAELEHERDDIRRMWLDRQMEVDDLRRERDQLTADAEQGIHPAERQLAEAVALLKSCRPWVARGLDDHPAPTDDDRSVLARLDAILKEKTP